MPQSPEQITKLRALFAASLKERDIPPVEVGRQLSKWIEGRPIAVVASELGLRDAGTIRQLVRLVSLPSDLHPLVAWGRREGTLSFSVAAEVARAKSTEEQRVLFRYALSNRSSKQTLQRLFRQTSDAGGSITDALDA